MSWFYFHIFTKVTLLRDFTCNWVFLQGCISTFTYTTANMSLQFVSANRYLWSVNVHCFLSEITENAIHSFLEPTTMSLLALLWPRNNPECKFKNFTVNLNVVNAKQKKDQKIFGIFWEKNIFRQFLISAASLYLLQCLVSLLNELPSDDFIGNWCYINKVELNWIKLYAHVNIVIDGLVISLKTINI